MSDYLTSPERLQALRESGLLNKSLAERIDHLAFAMCRLLLADAAQINALEGHVQHTVVGWPPGNWPDRELGDTGCREPVVTKAPVVINDTSEHPVTCQMSWTHLYRGYMGVPVFYQGIEVVGSICVLSKEPRSWKGYEVAAMTGVARLVAMSLDGA